MDQMSDKWKVLTPKHEPIISIAERFERKETRKSMFFYGPPGSGKTSLAQLIVERAKEDGRLAMYRSVQQIISRLRRCMSKECSETADGHIEMLINFSGLLVIDEIGRTKGDNWDKNDVIYRLIDERLDKHNIWISNYDLAGLAKHYDASISSRLQVAEIVNFDGIGDFRGRR